MRKTRKRSFLKSKINRKRTIPNNPYLANKKKKKVKIPLRYKLYTLAFIIIALPVGWFFLGCQIWNIDNIDIQGLTRTPEQEIRSIITDQTQEKKMLPVSQKNLIILDNDELKNKLNSTYRFEKIDIKKVWPNKLLLTIQEKPYTYIWQEADRYYYADEDNYILKEIEASNLKENNKYPIILNKNKNKITGDKVNAENQYIQTVLTINNELKKRTTDFTFAIDKFIITKEINTLKLTLTQGPEIYFDINGSIEEQLNNLKDLKQTKLKNNFKDKEYIDLRYGNRIYYK